MVWNPTVANLTLMALGSSAPEILLSVIETCQNLGKPPGELGPSTIVGSAAFNLMVISAVAIIAPKDGEVKKILDLGVFAITALTSLFAYLWLYLVLEVFSKGEIEIWEGVLTFSFFFILLLMAFIADKINTWRRKKTEGEMGIAARGGEFDVDDFIHVMNSNKSDVKDEAAKKKHIAI